ncbi:MAG: chorismate mutase [Bacilli bacterium]
MSKITQLRNEIDQIDDEIFVLLKKRMALSIQVKQYKEEHQIKVMDEGREQAIYNRIALLDNEMIINQQIKTIYDTILATSRSLQENKTK